MHNEIINSQQSDLIPYLKDFKCSFYLVGGTAIALHIGHRQSIDFDLFTPSKPDKSRIKAKFKEIANQTKNIFGQLFSEKLFREQLAFHKDIDYTEEIQTIALKFSTAISISDLPEKRTRPNNRTGEVNITCRIK